MSDIDLDGIRKRAEAATPGPWQVYRRTAAHIHGAGFHAIDSNGGNPVDSKADVWHIAGMDPQTTLALVAEVTRLRERVASLEADLRERGAIICGKCGCVMQPLNFPGGALCRDCGAVLR